MTYAQAKMVIWNHETYDSEVIREAALIVVDTLYAKFEDVNQAMSLL